MQLFLMALYVCSNLFRSWSRCSEHMAVSANICFIIQYVSLQIWLGAQDTTIYYLICLFQEFAHLPPF